MPSNNGYSSNQFLNLPSVETYSTNPIARTTDDNPEFLYPGKFAPNIYDTNLLNGLERLPVQRGFIRGIFPEIVGKIQKSAAENKKVSTDLKTKYNNLKPTVRRCFFQFNPSMILRTVQASSTTLNPLLQNPNQLLQAIPGQASFEFQLLFNREREVSGQQYRTPSGTMQPTKSYTQLLDNYGATTSFTDKKDPTNSRSALPYSQDQVGDLGVLVDLYVLDSIIGQSITQDTMDTIRAYWQASKSLRQTGELDSKGQPINPYKDEDFFSDSSKYVEGLNNVLGNSAFLNPMPVRIVFSSLFMVEGFVTASNVAFHKFSREMVPTVCQVTLSVQALYIGFAKKDSYITQQLENQIKTDIDNAIADEENTKIARDALRYQTQSRVANMSFSYEGWNVPGSVTSYINDGSTNTRPTSFTLNTWFKAIHDFNKQNQIYIDNNTKPTDPFVTKKDKPIVYTLTSKVSDSSNKSFKYWTSAVMKELRRNTGVTDLRIDSTKLYIYDVADINKNAKWATDDEIKKAAEAGKLHNGGSYNGLKPIAKTIIMKIDKLDELSENDDPSKKSDLSTIPSDDLIKGTSGTNFRCHYVTANMEEYGFDETRDTNAYFGNAVKILVIQSVTASFSGAGGGDVTVTVHKADVADFNPNKVINQGDSFGIDFYIGVYGKADIDK